MMRIEGTGQGYSVYHGQWLEHGGYLIIFNSETNQGIEAPNQFLKHSIDKHRAERKYTERQLSNRQEAYRGQYK